MPPKHIPENLYQAPVGRLVDRAAANRPKSGILPFVLVIALHLMVSVGALIMVPGFMAVFEGFGGSLPIETRILVATYR